MHLFFQQELGEETKLAIWKIEEEENFFLHKVSLQRSINHSHKRLQHLAGRYLLPLLFHDFPVALIQIADTLKPYLEDEAYHFSISHCNDFAAAIVSKTKRVRVDVELVSDKVQKVQHKFVSEEEMQVLWDLGKEKQQKNFFIAQNNISSDLLTLIWSCKEAVYKWYGSGELNFKEHIVIKKIKQMPESSYLTDICFQKNELQYLSLQSFNFPEEMPPLNNYKLQTTNYKLVLSYILT